MPILTFFVVLFCALSAESGFGESPSQKQPQISFHTNSDGFIVVESSKNVADDLISLVRDANQIAIRKDYFFEKPLDDSPRLSMTEFSLSPGPYISFTRGQDGKTLTSITIRFEDLTLLLQKNSDGAWEDTLGRKIEKPKERKADGEQPKGPIP